ncbi:MAG: hypothetical protein K8F59_07295 [Rhodobacteraceae bacterium]|nr:hypothetical protein [Paracoccaceae bacterium]
MAFQTFDEGVETILIEWNKAEGAIKKAEQVNGEVINPAVYELRYAGRRLVEAIHQQKTEPEVALRLLADAHFDCCRARHDAIDAATSKIAEDLDIATRKIGAHNILTYFPEWTILAHELLEVRDLIVQSRKDRENRDTIYAVLEKEKLDSIVGIYDKFRANENTMKKAAVAQRRTIIVSIAIAVVGVIVGVIGLSL